MTDVPLPEFSLFDDDGNMIQASAKFYTPPAEIVRWDERNSVWRRAPRPEPVVSDELEPLPDDYLPPDWPWPT